MQIAIIGNGTMGRWFARHFSGHEVRLYGKEESLADVSLADTVLVAVSLDQMPSITKSLSKIVQAKQLAFDIASVKSHFISEFKKLPCRTASVHPMFGSSALSLKGQSVILISDVGTIEDQKEVSAFFRGAKILQMGAKEHDKAMAYVLSLPYYLNISFESVVKEKFDEFAGPTFRSQKQIMNSILSNEKLAKDIIQLNPYSRKALNEVLRQLQKFDSRKRI